jgi:SRSO17 transposase
LPSKAWKTVTWREGTRHPLRSRFAAVRVRAAHWDHKPQHPREQEWLLIEWPSDEGEPRKYWLSNLPEKTRLRELVARAKQRWIIERDYEELKQELGLSHFEDRGWRGFHHHATLCIAAYGFLVAERSRFSPPRPKAAIIDYQAPNCRPTSSPEARIRPERHNPHSIATLRIILARSLLCQLCRCPSCGVQRL